MQNSPLSKSLSKAQGILVQEVKVVADGTTPCQHRIEWHRSAVDDWNPACPIISRGRGGVGFRPTPLELHLCQWRLSRAIVLPQKQIHSFYWFLHFTIYSVQCSVLSLGLNIIHRIYSQHSSHVRSETGHQASRYSAGQVANKKN